MRASHALQSMCTRWSSELKASLLALAATIVQRTDRAVAAYPIPPGHRADVTCNALQLSQGMRGITLHRKASKVWNPGRPLLALVPNVPLHHAADPPY